MIRFALAVALSLAPTLAPAAPGEQLQRQIAMGLREYRIYGVDTSKLTNHQAAALHLQLSDPEPRFFGTDFRTRNALLAILRWNPETDPGRK